MQEKNTVVILKEVSILRLKTNIQSRVFSISALVQKLEINSWNLVDNYVSKEKYQYLINTWVLSHKAFL